MLVSDLLRFRNNFLSKLQLIDNQALNDYVNLLNSIITENPNVVAFTAHEKITDAIREFNQLISSSSQIKNLLSNAVIDIDSAIDSAADSVLITNQSPPYDNYFNFGENEIYLKFNVSKEIDIAIKSNMHRYADFHFPGLQLGCRYPNSDLIYTPEMVANDPLYICDVNTELIEATSAQFNHIYNMRLRKYIIKNNNLQQLPHNQFGFIFSWMFFNFARFETLSTYLNKILALLRPGGTLMFSYNNCDLVDNMILFEQGFMSYIPKRKLLDLCRQLGYEIINDIDLPNDDDRIKYISWLEIKKPGELTTVKRAQAKGQILTK